MDKDELLRIVGNNLRILMAKKDIPAAELARRCQVSSSTISKIVSGNMSLSLMIAMNLAKGLEVGLPDLLRGVEDFSNLNQLHFEENEKPALTVGILSIGNRRITCVKDYNGKIMGRSALEGGLDLAEPTSAVMHRIKEAIYAALPKCDTSDASLKQIKLNLVTQSYEFEETRHKFKNFAERYFQQVMLMPDWQLTYLANFKDKPGISLIVDKGISVSYKVNDELKKIGGWKFPVYDLGGENWLGNETIRHTIEAAEKQVPMSELAHSVLAKFSGKISRILEYCFRSSRDQDVFCFFSEPLLRTYFLKDPAAIKIINRGFKHVQDLINLIDKQAGKELKICISGSLTKIYEQKLPEARLVKSITDEKKSTLLAEITYETLEKNKILIGEEL